MYFQLSICCGVCIFFVMCTYIMGKLVIPTDIPSNVA